MPRIAHISAGQITNISLAPDGWEPPQDGSQMLEADALAAGLPRAVDSNVVISVSMRGLRFALIDAGLLQAVIDAIAGIHDETQRLYAQTWWDTSTTVNSDHELVASLAAAVGQSAEQVRALFLQAVNKDATL